MEENKTNMIHQTNKYDFILLAVLSIAFFMILLIFGVRFDFPDSTSYINMSPEIPPVYPILIWVFRCIFPDTIYLSMVALFQNLLAAYCIWNFVIFIKKSFHLKTFTTYLISLIFFVPYVATGILTSSKMLITNSILTEGLTISLYLLFARFCLEVVLTYKRKPLLQGLLLSILMTLIRGQMIIPSIILFFIAIFWLVKTHNFIKKIIYVLVIVIAFFVIISSANKLYQKYISTEKTENTLNAMTVLTNVLYSSDKEDASLFRDAELQLVYSRMYELMEDTQLNYQYSQDGILNKARYIEDAHDRIKQEIAYKVFNKYLTQQNILEDTARTEKMLSMISKMTPVLLVDNFSHWLNNYFCSSMQGLVRTNSIIATGFTQFSILMYIIAIVLMLNCYRKNSKSKSALFMSMVLFMIFINAFGVSTTIMCLSRYMIYNMAIFYVALFLLMLEVKSNFTNNKN